MRPRRALGAIHHLAQLLAHAIEIAGDQLQLRVLERGAAVVGQRDPAVQIRGLVVARHRQHVVGVPRQAAREIRRFDAMLRRAVVLHRPDQRRARVERIGQLREADVIGAEAGDDLVADLPHRAGVVAEERALSLLPAASCRLPGGCASA